MSEKLVEKASEDRIEAITHIEDVDGVICGALILKKFPDAELEGGLPRPDSFDKEYDFITDLPLPEGVRTTVWIDHHANTSTGGECEEGVYDPSAKSVAGLVAKFLDIENDELVPLAERADSASYFTKPPTDEGEEGYDPAWDVNDAVKEVGSEEEFVELAETLAFEGVGKIGERFGDEISRTRTKRRKAERMFEVISEHLEGKGIDAPIIVSPSEELNNMTAWGHIVFSLYEGGVKACAIFFDGRCWLNARKDFEGINAGKIMQKHGGGGHEKSAGAPIGSDEAEAIREELEDAGLSSTIIDLGEESWNRKLKNL